jgi:hypothetical protein
MSGLMLLEGRLGRMTAMISAGVIAAFLNVSSSGAAGSGLFRNLVEGAGDASRKSDLDAPPLERALPMLGDGPEAHGRVAVLEAPERLGYYLVVADGSYIKSTTTPSLSPISTRQRGAASVARQFFLKKIIFD